MKVLLLLALLITSSIVEAQVRVRGYYRKNGTYVQPHYRSSPDGNPYNNWSYPGNVNPYTGKTASGSESSYLENYYKKNTNSKNASTVYSPPINSFKYKAIIDASFDPPLREQPNINSNELYRCEIGDCVYVIDDSGKQYFKVDINGHIGYLSRSFIKEFTVLPNTKIEPQYPYSSNVVNSSSNSYETDGNASILNREYIPPVNSFKYRTTIEASFDPPLREAPNIDSREIYKCPKGHFIYVIDNSGELYFKVDINGHTGYISKSFLKDKF